MLLMKNLLSAALGMILIFCAFMAVVGVVAAVAATLSS